MPSNSKPPRFPPPTSTSFKVPSSPSSPYTRYCKFQAVSESKSLSSKAGRILHNTYGPQFQFFDSTGNILGPFAPLLYTPDTFTPFLAHYSALVNVPLLTPRERELAILTTCSRTRAEYLLYAHRRIAKDVGLHTPQIEDAAEGRLPLGLSEREEIVCELVSELLDMWGKVSDEVWETGKKELGKETMSELIQVVGFYLQTSLLVNAADIGVPDDPVKEDAEEKEDERGRTRKSEGWGNGVMRRFEVERSRSPNPASLRGLEDVESHLLGRPLELDRRLTKRRSKRSKRSKHSKALEPPRAEEQSQSPSRPPSLTHSSDSDTESLATAPLELHRTASWSLDPQKAVPKVETVKSYSTNHQSMQGVLATVTPTAEEAEYEIKILLQGQSVQTQKPQRQLSVGSSYSDTSELPIGSPLDLHIELPTKPSVTNELRAMKSESPILGAAPWKKPPISNKRFSRMHTGHSNTDRSWHHSSKPSHPPSLTHSDSSVTDSPPLPGNPWDFEFYPSDTSSRSESGSISALLSKPLPPDPSLIGAKSNFPAPDQSNIHPAFRTISPSPELTPSPFPPPSKALPPHPPTLSSERGRQRAKSPIPMPLSKTPGSEKDTLVVENKGRDRARSRSPVPAPLKFGGEGADGESLAGKRWELWELELARSRAGTPDIKSGRGVSGTESLAREWI